MTKLEEKPKAGEETKDGEKEDTILDLARKEDGKRAKERGSRENVGTAEKRVTQRKIVQKEKEKETEAKEDGA